MIRPGKAVIATFGLYFSTSQVAADEEPTGVLRVNGVDVGALLISEIPGSDPVEYLAAGTVPVDTPEDASVEFIVRAIVDSVVNTHRVWHDIASSAAGISAEAAALVAASGNIDGFTMEEALRLCVAMLAGITSGSGTGAVVFRDLRNNVDRIVAQLDRRGNRTSVTLNADDAP